VVVAAFPALANIGFGALVFGQAISSKPISWTMVAIGLVQWIVLISATVIIAGVDE